MRLSLNKQSTASTWYHGVVSEQTKRASTWYHEVISEQTKRRFYLIPWGCLWTNKTPLLLDTMGMSLNKTPLLLDTMGLSLSTTSLPLDTMGLSLNKQNTASIWYHGVVAEQSVSSTWYHGVVAEQTKRCFYLITWGCRWTKHRFSGYHGFVTLQHSLYWLRCVNPSTAPSTDRIVFVF